MMTGTNVMLVRGYLTNDPQQRGESGTVATYNVSVPTAEGKWDIIPIKCFGKDAQRAMLLKKGNEIAVVARAKKNTFTRQDGTQQTVCDHIAVMQFTDMPGFQNIPYGFELLSKAVESIGTE